MRQLRALSAACSRELLWGLRTVSKETARWRTRATTIADAPLRDDALYAIDRKRANIDGAALFSTLPRRRALDLMRVLVAYEILADFLDCASERAAKEGVANGLRLHRALQDALNPAARGIDYYRLHPWREDGGYLPALIATCQDACARLPSFPAARPRIEHAARLTEVLAINHEPDPYLRDTLLVLWAGGRGGSGAGLTWFEWCGGASAWLTILALLALAADTGRDATEAEAVCNVYLPWISLAGTMLDSYADMVEDATSDAHSYIAHYPSQHAAIQRVSQILRRSRHEVTRLPDAPRHMVIVACMSAMYLSKDAARLPAMRRKTQSLARATGSLGHVLTPVLRVWRVIYSQQSA
jgi:tetraprenyl-beta-curcumene synthase